VVCCWGIDIAAYWWRMWIAGEGGKGSVRWREFYVVEEKGFETRNLRGVLEVSGVWEV
jgi:hypothetical protein